jgi:hypothetical protein
MPRPRALPSISPAQAKYVVDRLLADRRIHASDVSGYVADMQREILEIEQRLDELRTATAAFVPRSEPPRPSPTKNGRSRGRRRGDPLAGRYMGYMRQVPAAKKRKYQRIKEEHGFEVAIAALRADLGK